MNYWLFGTYTHATRILVRGVGFEPTEDWSIRS